MTREQEAGGFPREFLEEMVRRYAPERAAEMESWPEEIKRKALDRLGRAYGAALDRAILCGANEAANETPTGLA